MKYSLYNKVYLSKEAFGVFKEKYGCRREKITTYVGMEVHIHPFLPFTDEKGEIIHGFAFNERTKEESDEIDRTIKEWLST